MAKTHHNSHKSTTGGLHTVRPARHITGKHGHSLEWFEDKLRKGPEGRLSCSRRAKALVQYKSQVPE